MNWTAIRTVAMKNAVNAVLMTLTPVFQSPGTYNLHTGIGWVHLAELVSGAVLSRELLVWGPKVLAWSNSPTPGDNGHPPPAT